MNIVIGNLLIIFSIVLVTAIYIFTSMAMFKMAKNENIDKPWFAWIPILNDYLLIKLGNGSMYFLILAIIGVIIGNPYMQVNMMQNNSAQVITTVFIGLWTLYKVYLYSNVCSKYDIGVFLLAAGLILQVVPKGYFIGIILTLIAQVRLYLKVKKGIVNKTIIESKVIFSKRKNKNV